MRNLKGVVGCVFISGMLTGCASVQEEYNEQQHESAAVDTTLVQAQDIADSMEAEPYVLKESGSYSLPALLSLGLARNPQTRIAWWQGQQALAQAKRAEAPYFPTIVGNIQANHNQTGAILNQPTTKVDNWGPGLNVNYRLFQFGADHAGAESAAYALSAANYSENFTLQTVVFNIQSKYYQLASAIAKVNARQSSLQDAIASYQAAEKRMANGLAPKQDVLLAKADQIEAEYELQSAEGDRGRYRAELATVVGLSASSKLDIDITFGDPGDLTEEVEKLMDSALEKRADILAQEELLHAAEWAHLKSERERLPAVNLVGNLNTLRYRHDSNWQHNYGLGVNLTWTLFDGFDKQYKELEHYASMKVKLFELHQKKLTVLQDVCGEFHAFQAAKKLLASSTALEQAAKESLKAVRIGYSAGLNSLLDLLSAQKTLSNARLKRISAQSDLAIHWAKLAYVAGQIDVDKYQYGK
ncbi:MAG: TolC family protein [Opitutales bacterium]|nr:TolC family protein [Opitutales bacterium]